MYKTVVVSAPMGKNSFASDLDFLADAIETACNSLYSEGYEVISIMPSTRGVWDASLNFGASAWSLTDAAVITARRMETGNNVPPRMV